MRSPARLIRVSIALMVLLSVAAVDDFLSLHDIFKDYVSRPALDYLAIETSRQLPEWTGTSLEWTSLRISYSVRVVIIVLNIIVLLKLKSRLNLGRESRS